MRALLDANVFFSIWTLDPILSFADEEYFEPLWSERIMDEVRGHLPEVWDHATPQAVDHYVRVLDSAFPDASVAGWRPLERTIQLDDEDDRHVVAAAIAGRADLIVTWNLKDFPTDVLEGHGLRAVSPDGFLCMLFSIDPEESMALMRGLVSTKKRPPRTMGEEIQHLRQVGNTRFAALLSAHATEDDATAAPFPYTFLNTTTATRAAHRHQP